MYCQDQETQQKGLQAENLLIEVLRKLNAEVLTSKDELHLNSVAIVKTSKEIDEKEGIDFYLYHVGIGWIDVDLTINADSEKLSRKLEKERTRKVMILQCNFGVLWRAARGCEQDLHEMAQRIRQLFIESKL